jgi:ASC-1-like (ASCH) protein
MAMFARNFTRSRHLIQLIRSGQRTIEASVATPYFHELKPGDRVNVLSQRDGDLELVCEIVEKQHFKTVGELIAAVGVERIVGAGKTPKSGGRGGGEENEILLRGGASPNAVARQGVFAFHLKVVEDL